MDPRSPLRLAVLALAVACAPAESSPAPSPAPAPAPPAPPPVAEPVAAPVLAPADLEVPADPAALAAKLVRAEEVLRDPANTDEAVLDTWGHLQQRIYRALATDPARTAAVVPLLPEAWRARVEENVRASSLAMGTVPKPRSELPAWRIIPAPPGEQLLAWYREAEAATGTPWTLLAAVHLIETRMGRLDGVSYAGAMGPMQFMPGTWAAYGEGDPRDPRGAILAAGRYLAAMGAPKDIDKALWHYNHSDRYVEAVRIWHERMAAEPLTYRGYHGWEVYYQTTRGSLWLRQGYVADAKIPVDAWCDEDPSRCPAR